MHTHARAHVRSHTQVPCRALFLDTLHAHDWSSLEGDQERLKMLGELKAALAA